MARVVDRPETGFFLMRLRKGAPLVPARIARRCHCTPVGGNASREHDWTPSCDRHPPLTGLINGRPARPERIWNGARQEIDEAEYLHRMKVKDWAEQVGAPEARPHEAVNLNAMPSIF